jgi:hypothetical protein
MKIDRFTLPLISEIHRKLSVHTSFITIDLSQCFHSFKIRNADRPITNFTHKGIQYCFRKAPFGLIPISSVVQNTHEFVC